MTRMPIGALIFLCLRGDRLAYPKAMNESELNLLVMVLIPGPVLVPMLGMAAACRNDVQVASRERNGTAVAAGTSCVDAQR